MSINPQKYIQYLSLKSDPALALMQLIKQHEKEMEDYMKDHKEEMAKYMAECDKKMEEMMNEKIDKMEQKDPVNPGFIQKIVNQTVAQLVKDSKGDKGDAIIGPQGDIGPKGDSIVGPQGERGPQGIVGPMGSTGKDGRNGLSGIDGKTPQKGVDYFTKQEIQEFMDKIKESLKIGEIMNKLNELQTAISNLDRNQKLSGQKTLHRGGLALEWLEVPSGTVNDVNTVFTLAYTPADDNKVMVWFNGSLFKRNTDYTISGSTITTTTAPPTDSIIQITYQRQ